MPDPSIYIQNAVDIAEVPKHAQGQFCIFSKLGFGNGEFVNNQYACFPVLDDAGKPVREGNPRLAPSAIANPFGYGQTLCELDRLQTGNEHARPRQT